MSGPALALLAVLQMQAAVHTDTVHATPPPTVADAPGVHSTRADVMLGAAVLGTLAAVHIEGINEVDDLFGSQAVGADHLMRRVPRNLGRFEAVSAIAGGLYLFGGAAHHPEMHRAGLRALESLAISSLGTTALKIMVGRSRPGGGREEDSFHPFRFSSTSWSFPSGHTSAVFALAGALSSELGHDHPWVPFVAYPAATWVGVSRVVDGRHWATDVLAGAVVGVLSSRLASSWFGSPTAAGSGSAGNGSSDTGAGGGDRMDEPAVGASSSPRLSPAAFEAPNGQLMLGVRLSFR